jgi:hypothetical protein
MKLNIFEKIFKNKIEIIDEMNRLEGIKYGEKLYKDYLQKSSIESQLRFAETKNLFQ